MYEDSAEKSFYFGTKRQEDDDFELINQANDSALAQIFKKMQENHFQVMKKLDASLKLESLQQRLCELIDKKINQMVNMINDRLEARSENLVRAQPKSIQRIPQFKSPQRPIQQTEHERTYSTKHYNIQEDQQQENSVMINLAESEMEPIHEFLQTAVHRKISIKKEEDLIQELHENSNILQLFMNTFQEMNLEIGQCQKIFEFPKMAHLNFHSQIDKKKNILFLAELQNKEVVGAFTHLQFNPEPNYIPRENPKSFLCNITKGIFAFASRVNKTHSYDEDYLIFGNWQVKVRQKVDILETCWGTNGDCFRLKKYGKIQRLNITPLEFFGKGVQTKYLKMKRYNIYAFS